MITHSYTVSKTEWLNASKSLLSTIQSISSLSGPSLAIKPLPALGYGGLAGVLSLLSGSPFTTTPCTCKVGGAELECLKSLEDFGAGLFLGLFFGVLFDGDAPGAILRMKFIGALGLASARGKRFECSCGVCGWPGW